MTILVSTRFPQHLMFPTVTYVDSLSVIANPTAVKFNLDGTKMYVTGPGTNL